VIFPLILHRIQRQQQQLQWLKSENKNLPIFIYCNRINDNVDCHHLECTFALAYFFKNKNVFEEDTII